MFKKKPKFVKYLHTIGEAGTVKITNDTTPKLQDRGVHCIFVGYALNHPEGCYRMYDPATHRVHQSCDVVWLHRMFYEKHNNNTELNTNNISVGNWRNHGDGDHRFVEVGEGVIEDQSTDRIPSTTPGAEPPRDARDSGSARSHPTHLETSSSNRP